jgi:hypothetical protein
MQLCISSMNRRWSSKVLDGIEYFSAKIALGVSPKTWRVHVKFVLGGLEITSRPGTVFRSGKSSFLGYEDLPPYC